MIEVLGEALLKKLVEGAAGAVQKRLRLKLDKKTSVQLVTPKESLRFHLENLERWAGQISFRDLSRARSLSDSFVDLDLELGVWAKRTSKDKTGTFKVSGILNEKENFVILGDPGAGKTTSIKRIALAALSKSAGRKGSPGSTPLLLRLREFRSGQSVISTILGILGVNVVHDRVLKAAHRKSVELRIVATYLKRMKAIVLIDGLDELQSSLHGTVIRELRGLTIAASGFRVIVTCRTADFVYKLDAATILVIEPLSESQIKAFAGKWLGESAGRKILEKIRSSPYGGTEVRPLTLAHLCAIYYKSGSIPEMPRTVYRKIVRLLLEEWDEQRSVQRTTEYASFDVDRKEDFLKALAFELSVPHQGSYFSGKDLERAYGKIYDRFSLPRSEARKVAREIESHTGLVVQVSGDHYEFSHKSIQEYLTAEFILRLPKMPAEVSIESPNELALVVALSSDSSDHFVDVVVAALGRGVSLTERFTGPFLRRILLEGANFRQSRDLGCALIALVSETVWRSGVVGVPNEEFGEVLPRFAKTPNVLASVQLAFSGARLSALLESGSLYKMRMADVIGRDTCLERLGKKEFAVSDSLMAIFEISAVRLLDD